MALTLAIVTSMVSCTKDDNMNENEYQNSVNKETFGKKEWMLKSIYMNPAILDINGDGIKDAEMISSLQDEERTKTIVFASDGKVWENNTSISSPVQAGTWKPNDMGDYIHWIQKDGTIITAKREDFSKNMILFTYKSENSEISYTFQSE